MFSMVAAEAYAPCLLVLENIHSLGKDRDGNAEGKFFAYCQ